MSLDDYLDDESAIDVIDTKLVKMHKRIGDFWQKKTGRSASSLRRGIYGLAALAGGGSPLLGDGGVFYLTGAIAPLFAYYAITGKKCWKHYPKPNEIPELKRLGSRLPKYVNATVFYIGAVNVAIGTGLSIYHLCKGNGDQLQISLAALAQGLSVLSFASGNYLHQTDFDKPPPRKKRKSILQRIREGLQYLAPKPAYGLMPAGI